MSNDTLTAAALAKKIQKKFDISDAQAKDFINLYFSIIAREIKNKDSITLHGFGTFKKQWSEASTAQNPAQGGTVQVPAHYRIKFSAAAAVAEKINKPYARLKAVVIKEPPKQEPPAEPEHVVSAQQEISAAAPEPDSAALEIPAAPASAVVPAPVQQQVVAPHTSDVPRQNVQEQNVNAQVINRQIIQQQIIQQQIIRKVPPVDADGEPYDTDYDSESSAADDDDINKIVNRCWFIAGVAVVCTVILLAVLFSALFRSCGANKTAQSVAAQKQEQQLSDSEAAAHLPPNTYAQIADAQYDEQALWPYIYSANRLRYSDPDADIPQKQVVIPATPDRTLDQHDIEQAALDAYRAYRKLYMKNPQSARSIERRLRAARVIADTEKIDPGFISRYELSFDADDVKVADAMLSKTKKKGK